MLQKVISQSNTGYVYQPPLDFGIVLNAGVNTVMPTQLFWQVYKASDYPEVTCDKEYFFLFSTDHGRPLPKQDKAAWGKGNKLDLSDYEDIGIFNISPETSELEETLSMLRFIVEGSPKYYMYYSVPFERGISPNGEAETRLKISDGGVLHTATWVAADPINVLAEDLPQDFTTYLKIWNVEGVTKGTHYKQQSLPEFITGEIQVSTTANGLDWVRGNILEVDFDNITGGTTARFAFPSYGEYFKYLGQWWWVGTDQAKFGSSLTSATRGLVLCKSNTNLELTEQIMRLDNGVFAVESWHPNYLGGDWLHLYGTNINEGTTKYKRLDLRFLINHV